MKEKELEEKLSELGNRIEVNHELKVELRKSFEGKRPSRRRYFNKYMAAACAALIILAVGASLWFAPLIILQADSLRVQNYRTYLETESNQDLSVAEYKGTLYVPSVQEGIFFFIDNVK